jgi:hypothetical protein
MDNPMGKGMAKGGEPARAAISSLSRDRRKSVGTWRPVTRCSHGWFRAVDASCRGTWTFVPLPVRGKVKDVGRTWEEHTGDNGEVNRSVQLEDVLGSCWSRRSREKGEERTRSRPGLRTPRCVGLWRWRSLIPALHCTAPEGPWAAIPWHFSPRLPPQLLS